MKRIKKILFTFTMFLIGFSILGCISNLMTRHKCEELTAKRMLKEFNFEQIHLKGINLIQPFPNAAADVLKAAGLRLIQCDSALLKSQGCFPWVEMESRVRMPFIITIDWGGCDAPLSGIGYQSKFICIFGKIIRMSVEDSWVS